MITVKYKKLNESCGIFSNPKGDWMDLALAEDFSDNGARVEPKRVKNEEGKYHTVYKVKPSHNLLPLGVAMELPKEFEAIVAPRSSTFKNWGILQANSVGIIDNSFNGDDDWWRFPAVSFGKVDIPKGTRICQFRIQPTQWASWWTKLKWMFNSKINFVQVDELGNKSRGGFGSTGK